VRLIGISLGETKLATQPVSFDLHKLGWKAFEDLVACIFKDVMGQTFQIFAEGADGGRDGAFQGEWRPSLDEGMVGTFTVQCKHTSTPGLSLPMSVVDDELEKIARLAEAGLCDNYLLLTNHTVSAKKAADAEAAFRRAGAKLARVYGDSWINSTVAASATLRRLVPRIYGLGDLTQIVTHQAYRQARMVLDSLAPDLDCFVPTGAYRECAHALKEHGFVLLLGEPASGKTMIANLMAISAADEWELQTLMLSGPAEFARQWNPDDPGQFLWVDDAFGATQYDPERVREWNQLLPKLKSAIHNGARAVFTSRDYIFNSAKSDLKMSSFELFEDSRVVIRVEQLSMAERQMILYNHLKCGSQPRKFRAKVKPYLENAAATPKFLPEIARRFSNPRFTKNIHSHGSSVSAFFEEPVDWLADVVLQLSDADKSAIALVFIAGGNLPVPIPEDEQTLRSIATMRSSVGDVKAALVALNNSLLKRVRDGERQYWRFRHPTIRDAFAEFVGANPELIDIYLAGVTTERLMGEVICGDVDVQGAKIIIPRERYDEILKRLRQAKRTGVWYSDPVGSFLAIRCATDFLRRYFTEVEAIGCLPGEILSVARYDNSLRILRRLHNEGHLPNDVRIEAVKRVGQLSSGSYSTRFMDREIVGDLLTESESERLFAMIKDEVLSNEDDIISEVEDNWEKDADPNDNYSEIRKTLERVEDEGGDEEAARATAFLERVSESITSLESRQEAEPEYDNLETEDTGVEIHAVKRSVFDDIDE